tara:strand:- start:170 stop:412 length:243 start_codon:yes stop_codon:yes gene_type:complete
MLKLLFIFNLKDKRVGLDFKLSTNNLNAMYKMTVDDAIEKDELMEYATDDNIKNLMEVTKFIRDNRLYQTNRLRQFAMKK